MINEDLIQILPKWDYHGDGSDVNRWSRIHPRFLDHDGCIVDLGCLGWDWSKYFFDKKRIIGVDPQGESHKSCEFFKGALSRYNVKGALIGSDLGAKVAVGKTGDFDVLSWRKFKTKFSIENISILKINIEGGEWDLIPTIPKKDFKSIDQIAVSFHDWLDHSRVGDTKKCIDNILGCGFEMIDLGIYGWKLFMKK